MTETPGGSVIGRLNAQAGAQPQVSATELSERAQQTIRRSIERVGAARAEVGQLRDRVGVALSNARLSEEGKREEVERLVTEARRRIEEQLEAAKRAQETALKAAESKLDEVREVSPEVLSARAALLGPVLSGAHENPDALLNTYRRRFSDPVDRRLLEESAQLLDAFPERAGDFGYRWQQLQEELAGHRPPEERAALSDRWALQGLADYLAAAERLVGLDLTEIERGRLEGTELVIRAQDIAAVNAFESAHRASQER